MCTCVVVECLSACVHVCVFIAGISFTLSLCPVQVLGAVALFLIQQNSDAVVGRTMHPQRLKEIVNLLESDVVIQ